MTEGSWVSPKLEVRQSPMGGRGVFAKEQIGKGEVLSVSVGRVIGAEEYLRLVEQFSDLAYNIGPGQWLAPFDPASPTTDWLVNRSCDPNAGGTNDDDVTLVAWRDVAAGEEVTYDYATTEEDPDWRMWCRCGSTCCRRLITGNDWLLRAVQEKYAGHFTESIAVKIAQERANRDSHLDW